MKIIITGTKNSETSTKLAKHLRNCESKYKLDDKDKNQFIINYGRTNIKGNINKKIITNKLLQFQLFKEAGLNIPEIYSLNNFNSIVENIFPLMARKIKHARGNDIIFLQSKHSMKKRWNRVKKRQFLVQYIPKKIEYRVHVLGEVIIDISKKIHSPKAIEENTYIHPHIWNKERGWTLETIDDKELTTIKDLSIRAVKSLNYDFGAVDIILGNDEKYYILEVNSAPRLNKTRRRLYAKFFRQKEKEKYNVK